ncbi:hypothetical protein CTI12_AA155430 [Artemisia annua]|uniref:Uncharacterized protein n=1 Tax=Artemisia annua TaxID=35608 RepID=A0A2U1PGG2_ARTAN|nr:hypothetical protein CTI12_AA155430 [Artemisia annua]
MGSHCRRVRVEVDDLLETVRGFAFFVWNNRRAHGDERHEMPYKINFPPYLVYVLQTSDDGDTFEQTMNQIADDVGLPHGEWVVSYSRVGQPPGPMHINNDTD